LKSISLKFSKESLDPAETATIGSAESDGSTERHSEKHASTGTSQKPPSLPGGSADTSVAATPLVDTAALSPEPSTAATVVDTHAVSPEPSSAHAHSGFGKAHRASPATLSLLSEVIDFAHRERISDLQFQSGRFIYANGGGSTSPCEQWGKLSADVLPEILEVFYGHRTIFAGFESEDDQIAELWRRLMADLKIDFACEGKEEGGPLGMGRFRIQAHFSHQGIGMTIRLHSSKMASLDEVGLPAAVIESMRQKVTKKQGLGLVVGPTGSGKTTTLAALIDWIRQNYPKHIVTIEDPIEYCYAETIKVPGGLRPSPSLVTQQEVGHHVLSFEQGLNDALRKKPDVILVGEIRTAETLSIALEAVETGHFILSTMHTRGAGKTLGRMRQMYNLEQARGILQQFADSGSFILSQGLMPDLAGRYLLCCEYFAIEEIEDRNAIRKYAEGGFQDVEERLNRPWNRKWDTELKALLNAKRISTDVYKQFYQSTGLENK
jgi:twitching motility protein PilT